MVKKQSPRLAAAEAGEKQFVGNPCSFCHGKSRYTRTGACVECAKRRNREYTERIVGKLEAAESDREG